MAELQEKQNAAVVTQDQPAGLLDEILNKGFKARDDAQVERSKSLIADFVDQVMKGQLVMSKNLEAAINTRIAEIDRLQKIEASWRGLKHLVFETETGPMLKIRVMNVNKDALGKELEKAIEFDQSAVFKGIYEQEYGMFGG